jgi:hypothetical protein
VAVDSAERVVNRIIFGLIAPVSFGIEHAREPETAAVGECCPDMNADVLLFTDHVRSPGRFPSWW